LGMGTISGGLSWLSRGPKERSYFLLTDQPASDLRRLLRITGLAGDRSASIEHTSIQPSLLDLGIIEDGRLIDPLRANGLDSELKAFADELRS
ncbi:unnamed protein product, partial [marine sediment metagenome]